MRIKEKNTLKNFAEKNIEKSADSICFFLLHQPKAPKGLSKFSKKNN